MRLARLPRGALLCVLVLLALTPSARSGEPPNQNDPCSTAGRDTCGTLGIGFYKTYRYGIRWFGDYRGAIPGQAHTFCIDFRYWYPAPAHRYRETSAGTLRNRDGKTVSLERRRRIAYAVHAYGQSVKANQQAAVMLYVHSQMGDGRPGEVDPAALNPSVVALFKRIARDAAAYHGPYRIEIGLPDAGAATAPATIRVLSATGKAVPNVPLAVTVRGSTRPTRRARTGADGAARVTLPPATAATATFSVDAGPLPSTLPRIFAATAVPAAANSQRLVVPSSQIVTATVKRPFSKVQLAVSTNATPASLAVGEKSTDRVTISGALASWHAEVTVRIHGPFPSADRIRCDQPPAWKGSFKAAGPGAYTTPPAVLTRPGWYTYREAVPGDANHIGLTTPCGTSSENFRVEVQPRLATVVSADRVRPGATIFDRVTVAGLAGAKTTVHAALYGPFPSREAISCDGTPAWSGTIDVPLDGEYQTAPFALPAAGYYTYLEWIDPAGFARAARTTCGDTAETTVAVAVPQLRTKVSAREARAGSRITDTAVVTGLGTHSVPVRVELWGPFPTRAGIRCDGTPHWTGSFLAKGDGTYTTAPVQVDRAGYYTYRESIARSAVTDGALTPCGDAAETTLVKAKPVVSTVVSSEIVRTGSTVFDRIEVKGLGSTAATIEAELFGPFGSRAALRCSGKPYWRGAVTARGDGVVSSPPVKLTKAGFYTFRERLAGSALAAAVATDCALAAETSLAAPKILTGRGGKARLARAGRTASAPTRVRIASLGIDAPVSPVGIDVRAGALGVGPDIHRLGWWRDGAAPGSKAGTVLIAGHVDSKKAGAGAFFRLHRAKPGDRVQVETAAGLTFAYRVVSVRTNRKSALPLDLYSRKGRPRLVLVTCGGPFNAALGHYRDNIVLTAVPA